MDFFAIDDAFLRIYLFVDGCLWWFKGEKFYKPVREFQILLLHEEQLGLEKSNSQKYSSHIVVTNLNPIYFRYTHKFIFK
jgi:hypothetical protein